MLDSTQPSRRRASGILLHPSSLPGPYGIGDLGPTAAAWVANLSYAKQRHWQILPLGPTGYGDSPYQCFSAFAGNINLLSPERCLDDDLISPSDLDAYRLPDGPVDYATIIPFKRRLVQSAWEKLKADANHPLRNDFEVFRLTEAGWLNEFALFMALKDAHDGKAWTEWPVEFASRHPAALSRARQEFRHSIDACCFGQFLFFRQWEQVRRLANTKGIRIIGDLPIFVAHDSADVWAAPQLFRLDSRGRPKFVAGVPPDYFSATGQLWGNPLYDWDRMRETKFAWWIERIRSTLRMVDMVRLDHFRGFQAFWEIPADAATAAAGRWMLGPGEEFLGTMQAALGGLPLIAEDLGFITPEVETLREKFGLPGMRILQFAFGGAVENRFLPHNLDRNVVVYTGTHDNDTTLGWYDGFLDFNDPAGAGDFHFYRVATFVDPHQW